MLLLTLAGPRTRRALPPGARSWRRRTRRGCGWGCRRRWTSAGSWTLSSPSTVPPRGPPAPPPLAPDSSHSPAATCSSAPPVCVCVCGAPAHSGLPTSRWECAAHCVWAPTAPCASTARCVLAQAAGRGGAARAAAGARQHALRPRAVAARRPAQHVVQELHVLLLRHVGCWGAARGALPSTRGLALCSVKKSKKKPREQDTTPRHAHVGLVVDLRRSARANARGPTNADAQAALGLLRRPGRAATPPARSTPRAAARSAPPAAAPPRRAARPSGAGTASTATTRCGWAARAPASGPRRHTPHTHRGTCTCDAL